MRRTTTTVLGLVAATSLLTACGSADTDADAEGRSGASSSSSSGSSDTSSTPQTDPSASPAAHADVPVFPAGTRPQLVNAKGEHDLVLRDLRVAEHDGFDRLVVQLDGTGTPGWQVEYVDKPRAEGSGETVDVRGDHALQVMISGVTLPEGDPPPWDHYEGPRHFVPEDGGDVDDVDYLGWFEGYSQLFLGIDGDKAPFRVFTLDNPSRLVIDVQDD